jgi:MerR family redox-sensitive transcriptional activator SoxR
VDRIALIQFAQRAGFTVAEIRTLFEGFEEETPASERWQILAQQKLDEVNALIDRAERMKVVLAQALACGCLRLDDCASAIRVRSGSRDSSSRTSPVRSRRLQM